MATQLRSYGDAKSSGLPKALTSRLLLPAPAVVGSLMNSRKAWHAKRKCPVKRAWMMRALRASWSLKCAVAK